MIPTQPKALTWRVSSIEAGTTKEQLHSFFLQEDQDRVFVHSLCPDVDTPGFLVATIRFRPHVEHPNDRPKISGQHMEIDKDFGGFTPLYCPPNGGPIAVDIIAVTGLAGHAFGSWAHSEDKMWLRDYIPESAREARVLTYGYNSKLRGENAPMTTLEDLAKTFFNQLLDMRDSIESEARPIIFIGHSIGCLIIKKAMIEASESLGSSRLPVRAIIFLAAPHRGMDVDALRTLVKNEPSEQLVNELQPNSSMLQWLNSRFPIVAANIDILTCFETQKTKTVAYDESQKKWTRSGPEKMLLDSSSAKQIWPNETLVSADSNHSNIAKVKRGQGGIFPSVRGAIRRAMVSTAKIAQEHQWNKDSYMRSTPRQEQYRPSMQADQSAQQDHNPSNAWLHPGYEDTPDLTNTANFPRRPSPFETTPVDMRNSMPDRFWSSTPDRHDLRSRNNLPKPGACRNNDADRSEYSTKPQQNFAGFEAAAPFNDFAATQRTERSGFNSRLLQRPSMPTLRGTGMPRMDTGTPPPLPPPPLPPLLPAEQLVYDPGFPRGQQRPTANDASPQQHAEQLGHIHGLSHHPSMPVLSSFSKTDHSVSGYYQSIRSFATNNSRERTFMCEGCDAKMTGDPLHCVDCPDGNYCRQCLDHADHVHPENQHVPVHADDTMPQNVSQPSSSEHERNKKSAWRGDCIGCGEPILPTDTFHGCSICSLDGIHCKVQYGQTCTKHPQILLMEHQLTWYGERPSSIVMVDPKTQAEDSILVQALKEGDMKLLRKLVQNRSLVNEVNAENQTALHIAASLNLQAGARLLLKNGAKLEARDGSDCTALGQAILAKNEEFVSLMLSGGANPNSMELNGTLPLHLACRTGSVKIVDLLLDKVFSVDRPNSAGETALTISCRLEEWQISRNLLRRGADPNCKLSDGTETLLGQMASSNKSKAVKLLLDNGAHVEDRDSNGRTALFRAATNGHFGVCRTLVDYGANPNTASRDDEQTALGSAASNGKKNTVLTLLDLGADIEGADSRMRTPLFRAAAVGKIQVCQLLLEEDAESNPRMAYSFTSNFLMTILHVACWNGHAAVAELLVDYGANLKSLDECGRTALFLSAEYGKLEVCQSLIELSANIEATAMGHSVLSIAAHYGHLEVVDYLIEAGASAMPPSSVSGGKWKNFDFDDSVTTENEYKILELLRANKHR